MSLQQKYRELFDKEIMQKSKGIIFFVLPHQKLLSVRPLCSCGFGICRRRIGGVNAP